MLKAKNSAILTSVWRQNSVYLKDLEYSQSEVSPQHPLAWHNLEHWPLAQGLWTSHRPVNQTEELVLDEVHNETQSLKTVLIEWIPRDRRDILVLQKVIAEHGSPRRAQYPEPILMESHKFSLSVQWKIKHDERRFNPFMHTHHSDICYLLSHFPTSSI